MSQCPKFKTYENCKNLIYEADVLLFRHGRMFSIGWWIGKYTRSPYSHVGLAHWEDDELYVIEFREFIGSRKYKLKKYVENGQKIDVFRPCQTIEIPYITEIIGGHSLKHKKIEFDLQRANSITETAIGLIGKKYSWWTIWQMFKSYIPFLRFKTKAIKTTENLIKNFVCSTLVTYSYRKNFLDPVPFLVDNYTTPGDLGRSSIFFKLFEIDTGGKK